MTTLKWISFLALAMTIVPCLIFLSNAMDLGTVKWVSLGGTITWFVTAPIWMNRQPT